MKFTLEKLGEVGLGKGKVDLFHCYQEEIPKSELKVSTVVESSVKVGNQSKSN